MRTKTYLAPAILILAVLLSACGPITIAATQQPSQRTMNVTGTGQVFLDPDIAYINIGVHNEGAEAANAVAENNRTTQSVAAALEKGGVAKEDVRTTNFSIYPQQQYDQNGKVTETTYVVDNSVYVTVRDLTKLGDLLDATIQAGANSINSIQFDVADKTRALTQARQAAVKNAEGQAKELADAAGVKLGAVQSINFYDTTPVPLTTTYGKGGGGAAMEASANVPVQTGQLSLTVTVNLTYEIK
jgi:uncharacterized protein YggE